MTREEIIEAISDDKMMPFIQPDQLANIVDFVIKNSKPSLPSNLDEAAEEYLKQYNESAFGNGGDDWDDDILITFKAAAKWMAGQGVTLECLIDYKSGALVGIDDVQTQETLKDYCNKIGASRVIVQIRKK